MGSYGKPRNCVDVGGYDGRGNLTTFLCDGHADQQWVFRIEPNTVPYAFTIRNLESGFVLEDNHWNVEAKAFVPGRKRQHWYFTHWYPCEAEKDQRWMLCELSRQHTAANRLMHRLVNRGSSHL